MNTQGETLHLTSDASRLGIAVCSYKRTASTLELLDSLSLNTTVSSTIVVCEDGGMDGTARACANRGLAVVTGQNRGVAWNKNRGLYWLLSKTDATHILVIEDDMLVVSRGWQDEWLQAIDKWGHVNWADSAYMDTRENPQISGSGSLADPYLSVPTTGCLMGFRRDGLNEVGFFDTRFKGYGLEHVEFTRRFRRSGRGIELRPDATGKMQEYHVSIGGGVIMKELPSPADKDQTAQNKHVFESIRKEAVFRDAWVDSHERVCLLTEIDVAFSHYRSR